ncbi:MAG: endonuclease MutS2 [bacterium]
MLISHSPEELNLLEKSLKELEFISVLEYIAKKCYSEPGKELTLNSKPNTDIYWLRNEHELISEMIALITEDEQLPFEGYSDIRPLLYKSMIKNAVLSTTEILEVADTIRSGRLIKSYFQTREEKTPILYEEINFIFINRLLEKHINDAIDDTGEVRDSASKELSRIRREIQSKSTYLRHRLNKIMQKVSSDDMIQEEFISLREGRFVLPVKVEHKRHIPGIIHGLSQTGSTVFLEPSEIIELNNDLSLLINEEKREIYRILSNLTEEIGTEANEFLRTLNVIAHLDAIIAKANYALEFGGIKPNISDDNEIILNKVRHPLLVHTKGVKKVIPMNIEFNENKRGHLISGPNAGGKTVSLKSVGLNIAMALSGIFPLGECHTNYRMIYTSIGDHQSIEQDLSTFSSQIIKLKEILANSDPQSLVLIDEIGSGTDPQEGSALSAGILDTLIELKSYFIATTHNSALKSYALSRDVLRNASLEFDEDKLKPTYKFLEGVPGNSYAFQLAKNLGLTDLVLERAKKYLGTKQSELEESIAILHKYKSEAEKLKIEAAVEKAQAVDKRKKYDEKYTDIKQKRDVLIRKAHEDAASILQDANALVEKTIKEIQEQKKPVKEILKDFKKKKIQIEKNLEVQSEKSEKRKKDETLQAGDLVTTEVSTSNGIILNFDENNIALVDFNGIKFKLPVSQLIKSEKQVKTQRKKSEADFISFDVKSSIDIRGMRAYEAIPEVDELISNAVVNNLDKITIIHGKGTGALRHAIQEYLDTHYAIKSFRSGTLVEGGDGVTVVEI